MNVPRLRQLEIYKVGLGICDKKQNTGTDKHLHMVAECLSFFGGGRGRESTCHLHGILFSRQLQ